MSSLRQPRDRTSFTEISDLLGILRAVSPKAIKSYERNIIAGLVEPGPLPRGLSRAQRDHLNRQRDRLKLRGRAYQEIVAKLREIKKLLALDKKRSAIPCDCIGCQGQGTIHEFTTVFAE